MSQETDQALDLERDAQREPAANDEEAKATVPEGNEEGLPPGDNSEELPPANAFVIWFGRLVVGFFLIAAAGAALMALQFSTANSGRWWARAFAFGTIGIGLLVLQSIGGRGNGNYGMLRPLIGADRRFSTSLTQLGLWTLVAGIAFAWMIGRVLFDEADLEAVLPSDLWDEYLILLGGPFAAAVLAKGIVTYKLQAGTLQKTEPAMTSASQVLTNDRGNTDLVDAQYLIFNLVALGYFSISTIATGQLPAMPEPLLAMTGSSAALYVGNKAALRNAPTITAVTPRSARPGDVVTIFGTNFDPAEKNDSARRITVSVTGWEATIYSVDSTDTRVRFRVPPGAVSGDQIVIVTSTAGVETEPHFLLVMHKA